MVPKKQLGDILKCVGALIKGDGKNNIEIISCIAQAKMNSQRVITNLTNKHISIQTRKKESLNVV